MAAVKRLLNAWVRRARTPRGVVATVCALAVAAASASGEPAASLVVLTVASWWVAWWLLGWIRGAWEDASRPPTPPFARVTGPRGTRTQLRHDPNAAFLRDRGFMWRRRYWFVATGCPPIEIAAERLEDLQRAQAEHPVAVVQSDLRTWWMFEDEFYWDNEGYEADDVKALIRQRERQRKRKLDHAKALMVAEEQGPRSRREGIPLEVRRNVWKRDGGRCVECGRGELLELDHVIPLSMGGSNTEKNLQLLCAECNRAKGGAL